MKAKSIKGKSPEEIKIVLLQSMVDGFKPTLAITFLSVKQDRIATSKILEDAGLKIFGTTTNGEFIDEELEQGTTAILLLDIAPANFFIRFTELNGVDDRSITKALGDEALGKFRHPAFIIAASNMQTDCEQLLLGFEDAAGSNVNVFGAMAGDDITFTEQYVFSNGKSSARGIVTLVLDEDKIMVKGRATSGWKAVGTEKTATRCEGNRVYTIENIPALDICLKYSGLSADHPNLALELGTNFPLQLQRANGSPVIRPSFIINWQDRSLMTSGIIPQGAKVRFSLPPDFDTIEKVIQECKDLKETEIPDADAVIIFNCGGRLVTFGPLIAKEIEGVKNVWNVPMAGMFSNAELARATNGNLEMHNLTTCCVAIKEK